MKSASVGGAVIAEQSKAGNVKRWLENECNDLAAAGVQCRQSVAQLKSDTR